MQKHLFLFAIALVLPVWQCRPPAFKRILQLPSALRECSGIVTLNNGKTVWTHNDSGGETAIYEVNVATGQIIRTLQIDNVTNKDWEDLTHDSEGNLYIGDFGNNRQRRKDLCIYKVKQPTKHQKLLVRAEKITFQFADQNAFPPKKKYRNYDCEAFFHYKNQLYLFSKNHTKSYSGFTKIYKMPDVTGNYTVAPLDSFRTGRSMYASWITSAAISPDEKHVALLSSDKIFLFSDFQNDAFFKGKCKKILLENFSQKEAICFQDNQTLLVADEKTIKTIGGNLYRIKIN
jgi:hypothetical protein